MAAGQPFVMGLLRQRGALANCHLLLAAMLPQPIAVGVHDQPVVAIFQQERCLLGADLGLDSGP
jgi:hypothetical protein